MGFLKVLFVDVQIVMMYFLDTTYTRLYLYPGEVFRGPLKAQTLAPVSKPEEKKLSNIDCSTKLLEDLFVDQIFEL